MKTFSARVALPLMLFAMAASAPGAQNAAQVQELINQLKDKDEAVGLKAAKELGKLKEKAKDAIPALTIAASKDADEDVQAVAKKALEAIKEAVGETDKDKIREMIEPLLKDLKGNNAEKRIAALNQLAEFGTPARSAGADVVEFGLLRTPQPIQEAAVAALEKIDPEAGKLIVTLIFDKNRDNKADAIQGLEALGLKGKSAMPALKAYYGHLMTTPGGSDSSSSALHAMAKIAPDDKAVVDVVLGIVTMPVPMRGGRVVRTSHRHLAIELLPELKAEKKVKIAALITALNDPYCRVQVIGELGKFGAAAKDALPLLTKLKLDSDAQVREAAAAAIDLIKD